MTERAPEAAETLGELHTSEISNLSAASALLECTQTERPVVVNSNGTVRSGPVYIDNIYEAGKPKTQDNFLAQRIVDASIPNDVVTNLQYKGGVYTSFKGTVLPGEELWEIDTKGSHHDTLVKPGTEKYQEVINELRKFDFDKLCPARDKK
jgi:hypothetical protein